MSNDFWPGFIATLLALIFVTLFVSFEMLSRIDDNLKLVADELHVEHGGQCPRVGK